MLSEVGSRQLRTSFFATRWPTGLTSVTKPALFSRRGIAILRRLTAEDAEEQRIAEDSGKKSLGIDGQVSSATLRSSASSALKLLLLSIRDPRFAAGPVVASREKGNGRNQPKKHDQALG